ncbi:MAG: nitrite/sulfite reductase [Rhodospirillales bacterium]|nr:nitrite/sulfite reductase [Rhodospirillales bacterium]
MYVYDEYDRTLVAERVAQFRGQVARRLSGELSEDEFRPLRLMNGLYMQLHAYMLRVAIPYGTLSSVQMRQLAMIARKYDKGYGHFTTRQNIQYNWPKLDAVPDILADLAKVEMHAHQTSGNCIRNVTADQYAGAAADEIEDARITSEVIRQWSTFHPEFSFLPRKFKIAVTGSPHDRAAIKVHDIGLRTIRNDHGEVGYEVVVGGGLGRTPIVGLTIREFLPKRHLLSYLEAILRVYNQEGRRDNLFKARIKILVQSMGGTAFTEKVEAEWRAIRKDAVDFSSEDFARIAAQFAPPRYVTSTAHSAEFEAARLADKDFEAWCRTNLAPHKQPGYAIVNISLKPIGGVPGDATAEDMELFAKIAELWSFSAIRVTHSQNLVLPYVRLSDVHAVWQALRGAGLAAPNIDLITDIISCPGLDYCNLANARSIPVAQRISERFASLDRQYDIGELKIKISGCINACGHHHVGHIGLLGVDKKGEEFYQITLGGSADENASLGTLVGPAFSYDRVVDAVETLVETYVTKRQPGEIFLDTYRRLGVAPFKEALYGSHPA